MVWIVACPVLGRINDNRSIFCMEIQPIATQSAEFDSGLIVGLLFFVSMVADKKIFRVASASCAPRSALIHGLVFDLGF